MKKLKPAALGELLLYLLIMLLPFEQLTNFGGMAVTKLVGILFFMISIVDRDYYYGSVPSVFLAFFLYVGIATGIDVVSSSLDFAWVNEIATPLQTCILMIVIYNISVGNRAGKIVLALYLSSLVYAVAQAFELGGDYVVTSSQVVSGALEDRVSTLRGDPNFTACFISLSVVAGIIYGFNLVPTGWRCRIFALCGSALGFWAIIKTASRGGLLALLAGISCLALVKAQWNKRIKYAVFAAVLLSLMSVLIEDNPLFRERVLSSMENGETADRFAIWESALDLSLESPVFGFGYRSNMFELGKKMGQPRRGTHNIFLSILLGSGYLGLLCFMCFYFCSFKNIWANKSEGLNIIIFSWFTIGMVSGLSLNVEIAKWFWILLALALGAGKEGWRPKSSEAWTGCFTPLSINAALQGGLQQSRWKSESALAVPHLPDGIHRTD